MEYKETEGEILFRAFIGAILPDQSDVNTPKGRWLWKKYA
jgi:hypothetical protein